MMPKMPVQTTPNTVSGIVTYQGWPTTRAMTVAIRHAIPKTMQHFQVVRTILRAMPFWDNQPSRPPRQPISGPPMPPIQGAISGDHQPLSTVALTEVSPAEEKPPEYRTSLTGVKYTVPCPGRIRLISNRVGGLEAPVGSKGSVKFRQSRVPVILPISPESPSVREKYCPSGMPGCTGGKKFHISKYPVPCTFSY